jgi:aspartate-semialdehyde dehydrogenase
MRERNKKIPVGILGATGSVGQKFIELLSNHPWFEIVALTASERSAGKKYKDAVNWFLSATLPSSIGAMTVQNSEPKLSCPLVFSALDASAAGKIEMEFAKAGYFVISNAKNYRMTNNVPLLIPDVNPDHITMINKQTTKGRILTNPNCSTTGLVVALKPLFDRFGIDAVHVVTMQALSGAGYPGVSSLDVVDNVIPFIGGEESKLETEPLKILGTPENPTDFKISATCNRVPVVDGHMECVSVKLNSAPEIQKMIETFELYRSRPQELELPMAPAQPIYYFNEDNMPQPRILRNLDKGMAISIGRLRPCPILDYKFTILSHNTVRGAAGGAILNAELLVSEGYLD